MKLPSIHIPHSKWDIRYAWEMSKQSGLSLYTVEHDPLVYIDGVPFLLPSGVSTDLASIPFGARNTFCPADVRYSHAAPVHDILYAAELIPRGDADMIFWAILKHDGVDGIEDDIMYQAVNLGGWTTYKDHTPETVKQARELFGLGYLTRRPLFDFIPDLGMLWEISPYYNSRKVKHGRVVLR